MLIVEEAKIRYAKLIQCITCQDLAPMTLFYGLARLRRGLSAVILVRHYSGGLADAPDFTYTHTWDAIVVWRTGSRDQASDLFLDRGI